MSAEVEDGAVPMDLESPEDEASMSIDPPATSIMIPPAPMATHESQYMPPTSATAPPHQPTTVSALPPPPSSATNASAPVRSAPQTNARPSSSGSRPSSGSFIR